MQLTAVSNLNYAIGSKTEQKTEQKKNGIPFHLKTYI